MTPTLPRFGVSGLAGAVQSERSFARRVLHADATLEDPVEEWFARQWRRRDPEDQRALRQLLGSSVGSSMEQIRALSTPTLVLMGDDDDPDDGRGLADTLGQAEYAEVPGDHIRAVGKPEVAVAIADFLDAGTY